jgi:hypothetical protein
MEDAPLGIRIKRSLALPWNRLVKAQTKMIIKKMESIRMNTSKAEPGHVNNATQPPAPLRAGDWVRVKDRSEIESSLDRWGELKGCAFLDSMSAYCGTTRQVLQPLERFLDERDYKVKKCRGVVLLDNVTCLGTPVFGRCDRRCYLFWREEWLERIAAPDHRDPA